MLAIQYCARHYYNFAEYLNYTSWAICIVTTIILSLPTVSSFLGEKKIIAALIFEQVRKKWTMEKNTLLM